MITTCTSTGTTTGTDCKIYCNGTGCHLTCTNNCSNCCDTCTLSCYRTNINGTTVITCYTKDLEPQEITIYYDIVDKEEIRFWRKQAFQRSRYVSLFFPKPRIKRKSIISISGWLTRKEYKRKKGYSKK